MPNPKKEREILPNPTPSTQDRERAIKQAAIEEVDLHRTNRGSWESRTKSQNKAAVNIMRAHVDRYEKALDRVRRGLTAECPKCLRYGKIVVMRKWIDCPQCKGEKWTKP